jgi:hypothetical protein
LYSSHGPGTPVVSECDGDYTYEKRGVLLWQLPVIDGSNKTGSMEFTCHGVPDDFFPIRVSFYSKKSYSGIQVRHEVENSIILKWCLLKKFNLTNFCIQL